MISMLLTDLSLPQKQRKSREVLVLPRAEHRTVLPRHRMTVRTQPLSRDRRLPRVLTHRQIRPRLGRAHKILRMDRTAEVLLM